MNKIQTITSVLQIYIFKKLCRLPIPDLENEQTHVTLRAIPDHSVTPLYSYTPALNFIAGIPNT
jgi:hypothetical protein